MKRSRIAVIGAGHWHVPLYAETLVRRHEIVAVQDEDVALAAPLAKLAGVSPSSDRTAALDLPGIDLAYVFGAHDLMFDTCMRLVDKGIPFVVEKPGGLGLEQLDELLAAVEKAGVPTAVPLVQRGGPIETWLRRAGDVSYFRAAFVAGPPARYLANGSPWMLEPERSGGGCTVNLAPHFVDMYLRAVGTADVEVYSSMSSALHHGKVEDHATLVLRTADGREGVIEIGYAFPGSPLKRSSSYTAAGSAGYAEISGQGVALFTDAAGETTAGTLDPDSDPLYGPFADAVADSLADSFAPLASLRELRKTMAVVWRAYRQSEELAEEENRWENRRSTR